MPLWGAVLLFALGAMLGSWALRTALSMAVQEELEGEVSTYMGLAPLVAHGRAAREMLDSPLYVVLLAWLWLLVGVLWGLASAPFRRAT
jgi:hypothetical protein